MTDRYVHFVDQSDALLEDLVTRARRDMELVADGDESVGELGRDIADLVATADHPVVIMALLRAAFEVALRRSQSTT